VVIAKEKTLSCLAYYSVIEP